MRSLKVAVYDPEEHIERFLEEISEQLPPDLKVVTSGNMWMDIQNKSINKGIAIRFLQEKWHLKPEECMAFGDQMNDYEMLQDRRSCLRDGQCCRTDQSDCQIPLSRITNIRVWCKRSNSI